MGPSPETYSLQSQTQALTHQRHTYRAPTFSSSPHLKCDFFYPDRSLLVNPTTSSPYLHELNRHNYSSLRDVRHTFKFDKQLTRDQASDIKQVLHILNERKKMKEGEKLRRLQAYTLGEMEKEEENKRLYPGGNHDPSYDPHNPRALEPQIRLQDERLRLPLEVYRPYLKKEAKGLFTELKQNIKDHEFLLHGRLKESFSTVIDRFPVFRNGHKGPEMTTALRKMLENRTAVEAKEVV